MHDMAFEWWLRPVIMQLRLGEQSAVVCMLLKRSPFAARWSRLGVRMGEPKQPRCPKPVSSRTMKSTLGEPGLARSGAGHAGDDSPMVLPMTPGNAVPGSYSLIAMCPPQRRAVARFHLWVGRAMARSQGEP